VRWIPPYDDGESPYWSESFRIRVRSRVRMESRPFTLADCAFGAK
jgi:hypothetical protein